MDKDKAIELMKKSSSIEEWNINRKEVLLSIGNIEKGHWFYSEIDGNGLCVKTIKQLNN